MEPGQVGEHSGLLRFPIGLVNYLEDFIAQNTVQGDSGVTLDVSPEEYQALADFLFQGMVVWMLSVERVRWSRHHTLAAQSTTLFNALILQLEVRSYGHHWLKTVWDEAFFIIHSPFFILVKVKTPTF